MNRILIIFLVAIFCMLNTNVFAFEVTNVRTTVPEHSAYLGIPLYFSSAPKYTFTTFKGTLKANLEHVAYLHHWTIAWCSKKIYYVMSEDEISGTNFHDVTEKLLSHYPLQATYDTKNKVLSIDDLPAKKPAPIK